MRPFITALFMCTLFAACNEQQNTEPPVSSTPPTEEVVAEPKSSPKDALPAKPARRIGVVDTLLSKNMLANIRSLREDYGDVLAYSEWDGILYYYIASKPLKGKYNVFSKENLDDAKIGLVMGNGQLVLQPLYDKIYNPNTTVIGGIVTEKGGLRGLFMPERSLYIEPTYDQIYPSSVDSVLAYVKKKGELGYLNQDGEEVMDGYMQDMLASIMNWQVSNEDANFVDVLMIDDAYTFKTDERLESANGVMLLPSYINEWGLEENGENDLIPTGKDDLYYEGTYTNSVEVSEVQEVSTGIWALVTDFMDHGIGIRSDYIRTKKYLVTVDNSNTPIEKIKLSDASDDVYALCNINAKIKIIDQRVKNTDTQEEIISSAQPYNLVIETYTQGALNGYDKYDEAVSYSYIGVKYDGKTEQMATARIWDCTKFVFMDESYFKGCFAQGMNERDEHGRSTIQITQHLAAEDLDIMRNEIYAEYGYRFKSDKWDKYFANKPWYTPRFDNVDDQLNPYEKHNIALIVKMKQELLNSGDELLQTRRSQYSAAG